MLHRQQQQREPQLAKAVPKATPFSPLFSLESHNLSP